MGAVVLMTSFTSLSGPTAGHGQVVGVSSIVLSIAAAVIVGGERLPLRTFLLVGLTVCGMSTLGLMDEASRDVGTHCSLAEAHTRILHLEEKMTAMKHDDMMTQIFFRMNELDDMLDLVQQGSVGISEIKAQQSNLHSQDKQYIRAKVEQLKAHSHSVIEGLKHKTASAKANAGVANIAAAAAGFDSSVTADTAVVKQMERRMEAVQAVLTYLDSKEGMTFQEYEIILSALLEGGKEDSSPVDQLKRDHATLEASREVFDRHHSQSYTPDLHSPEMQSLSRLDKKREDSRKEFEARYSQVLQTHSWSHPQIFKHSLDSALADLPAHCLDDVAGYKVLRFAGTALLAAQAMVAYALLTSSVFAVLKDQ
ncbi:MAG: hypothetical protein WDW36_004974 [Sanguina aurantia]